MKKNILTLILFVVVGILSRIIPHPWNFTGITALAIFAGVLSKDNKTLFLAPLLALFISDMIIGFHSTMIATYLGFAIVGFLSVVLHNEKQIRYSENNLLKQSGILSLMAISGSFIFFAISNLGVWLSSGMYELSFAGLVQCFIAALPFLDNQLAGDLFYSFIFLFVYKASLVSMRQEA